MSTAAKAAPIAAIVGMGGGGVFTNVVRASRQDRTLTTRRQVRGAAHQTGKDGRPDMCGHDYEKPRGGEMSERFHHVPYHLIDNHGRY